MGNILITGITGFIGSNLVRYLNETSEVNIYGQSRNPERARERFGDGIKDCITDVDSNWLDENNIDAIIHLAGIAHDLKGKYKEEDYQEINVKKTQEIFEKFQASSVSSKFIFLSSVKAVTDTCEGILNETANPDPLTPYGKSKLEAEEIILQNKKSEKKVYVLRPAMVYGPGNKGNLNLLYRFVKSGIPYPLAAFGNMRSFLSVNNLCFVIESIIKQQVPTGTYHLSDGEDLSTNELVDVIGKACDKHVRKLAIPKSMIRCMASAGTFFKLPLNKQSLQKLTESYRVSNRKITTVLDRAMPYKTKDELVNTIRSFNEH